MSIITKAREALSSSKGSAPRKVYETRVRCLRCGEVLAARINLLNDLSIDYERDVYTVRKLVTGSGANRCFQSVEIVLTFDKNRRLTERWIAGGTFVDEPETAE